MFPRTLASLACAAALACLSAPAHAALSIFSSVGGAPNQPGVARLNLDNLALGTGTPQVVNSEVTLLLTGNARVVQGSVIGQYAAPFLSGANGTGFGAGNGNQADGQDATPYLTSGSTNSVPGSAATLAFATSQGYLGLLWGSVDTYNTLDFFSGDTLLGSITGGQVTPAATGNQGAQGSYYVNVLSSLPFDRVVARSSSFAFEFDNVAYAQSINVPEPGSLALLAGALLGVGLMARRAPRRG